MSYVVNVAHIEGNGADFRIVFTELDDKYSVYIKANDADSVWLGTFDEPATAFELVDLISTCFTFAEYQVELADEFIEEGGL